MDKKVKDLHTKLADVYNTMWAAYKKYLEDYSVRHINSAADTLEEKYRDGELSELAQMLHYDLHWLSRTIKRLTGKTYTELVQAKRMRQAAYLLQTSRLSVGDIALAVGYENISYFHRLFQKTYQMSPRKYRIRQREERT